MTAKKKPAPRKGGKPVYTPETAEARKAGAISIKIAPHLAQRLREQLGAAHPGGVSGWVAEQVAGAEAPLLSPTAARALAKIARDTGYSPSEVLGSLLGVDPLLWALLLTAARQTGQTPEDLIAPLIRDAVLTAARASVAADAAKN